MSKKQAEPKTPRPKKLKKTPKELVIGKIAMQYTPRLYARQVRRADPFLKRIAGIDLGNNCGVAFADLLPGVEVQAAPIIMGQWSLHLSRYDSGIMRHCRLRSFLTILQPDLIIFENVKYTPPLSQFSGAVTPAAVAARVSTAAEMLGGLKLTLTHWAHCHDIPYEGVSIQDIKQFATGRGNANKVDIILAANAKFGTNFDSNHYEQTGVDNICDAAFACAIGVEWYLHGLKEPPFDHAG